MLVLGSLGSTELRGESRYSKNKCRLFIIKLKYKTRRLTSFSLLSSHLSIKRIFAIV